MTAVVDRHAGMLARDGWCVFGRAVEPVVIACVEANLDARFAAIPLCQGAFYGARTKRFGSLLTRAPAVEQLVMHPLILELVEQMLLPWCERIALNLTKAIEIHPGPAAAAPSRSGHVARPNRLFELGLGPVALALCGASDPATQARIDAILVEHGASDFAACFLSDAGLEWAAALLADFPDPQAPQEGEM